MKMFKKAFAMVLCIAVLACSAAVMSVSASEIITEVDALRWFPVPENRQNDDAWEAECVADGCLCQRFNETAEDTGNTNYLDTEYTAEGGLKLTRNDSTVMLNGTDYTERYWPRIRTLSLETSPEFDLKTANTLYFDIVVEEGTEWNFSMSINGMNISFGKFMAAAAGASIDPMDTSIVDAPAGSFKGSINITDVIDQLAADSTQLDTVNAQALKNMKKTFVPQLQVYCIGGIGASMTINELYLTTADDTDGANCTFVDMGLLSGLGEEYYEAVGNEGDTNEGDTNEGDSNEGDTTESTDGESDETTKPTTKPTTKKPASSEGGNMLPIIIVVVAVVVVAAVVVIVVMKKKKA